MTNDVAITNMESATCRLDSIKLAYSIMDANSNLR